MEVKIMALAQTKAWEGKPAGPPACGGCSSCFSSTMGEKYEQFSPALRLKLELIRQAIESINYEHKMGNIAGALERRDELDKLLVEAVGILPQSRQDAFCGAFFEMAKAHTSTEAAYEFINGE